MEPITIPTIVEGHGEVRALPVLLRRLVSEIAPGLHVQIPPPIRIPKGSYMNRTSERERTIKLACLKAKNRNRSFILLLFDSDDDCPAETAPKILEDSISIRDDYSMALTLAKFEFEAWFLAAAVSLRGCRNLPNDLERPEFPENIRDAKGWIKKHRSDNAYSPTVDQAAYSAQFDFSEAREHSPSFDKFFRDVKRMMTPFLP